MPRNTLAMRRVGMLRQGDGSAEILRQQKKRGSRLGSRAPKGRVPLIRPRRDRIMGSSILDALHQESITYTERYELLPTATSAMLTAVSIAVRILGSTQSGLVVGTKLGTESRLAHISLSFSICLWPRFLRGLHLAAFGYVGISPAPEHPAIAEANALRRLDLP